MISLLAGSVVFGGIWGFAFATNPLTAILGGAVIGILWALFCIHFDMP